MSESGSDAEAAGGMKTSCRRGRDSMSTGSSSSNDSNSCGSCSRSSSGCSHCSAPVDEEKDVEDYPGDETMSPDIDNANENDENDDASSCQSLLDESLDSDASGDDAEGRLKDRKVSGVGITWHCK